MKKILIATFALAVVVGACKKEDVTKVTPEVEIKDVDGNGTSTISTNFKPVAGYNYTVVNGRPVFANLDYFVQMINSMHTKTKADILANWSTTCGYSNLLKKSTEQSTWADVPPNITTLAKSGVEDVVYAAILNDQGEIQLGDSIVKVIQDKEYIYHTNNASAIATSANAQANGTIESLSEQLQATSGVRVRNTLISLEEVPTGQTERGNCPFYNLFVKTQGFATGQRSYFKLANRSYFFYAAINIQVDIERRLTGWFGIPAGWGHTNVVTLKQYDYFINYRMRGGRNGACETKASGLGTVSSSLPISSAIPQVWNDTNQHGENIQYLAGLSVWFDIRYVRANFSNSYNGVTHTHLIDLCDANNWCL